MERYATNMGTAIYEDQESHQIVVEWIFAECHSNRKSVRRLRFWEHVTLCQELRLTVTLKVSTQYQSVDLVKINLMPLGMLKLSQT